METTNYKELYDNAVDRVMSLSDGNHQECLNKPESLFDFVFPEFKESNDKKVREALIEGLNDLVSEGWSDFGGYPIHDILKCLNKEEPSKITTQTKYTPKFNVGDFIIPKKGENECGHPLLITSIEDYTDSKSARYVYEYGRFDNVHSADDYYRRWELSDAKPGDILHFDNYCGYSGIMLFKKLNGHSYVDGYCFIINGRGFMVNGINVTSCETEIIKPANEEQRKRLMDAIKENGYEWKPDTLELMKVVNGEPLLTNEDKNMIDNLISIFGTLTPNVGYMVKNGSSPDSKTISSKEIVKWLKSLKEKKWN